MTTIKQSAIPTRFRYISNDDIIYVGEAEISIDDEVTILSCWRFGTTVEEFHPYGSDCPYQLRREIENCAMECRMTPPASPVELPTDWDELEVLDTEITYTVAMKAILPDIKTDMEANTYGLRAVSRVRSMNAGKQYQVTAKGGIDDVRRELHRIRLF